jgi:Na+/H+ antiporter NhaC
VRYLVTIVPPKLSPANAGLLCVLTSSVGGILEDMGTIQPMVG